MKEILFAQCANFPDVVDEAHVSLRRPVALDNTNVSKTLKKICPGVSSDAVSYRQPDFVLPVVVSLAREEIDREREE